MAIVTPCRSDMSPLGPPTPQQYVSQHPICFALHQGHPGFPGWPWRQSSRSAVLRNSEQVVNLHLPDTQESDCCHAQLEISRRLTDENIYCAGLSSGSHLADGRIRLIMVKECSQFQYLRFLASIPGSGAPFLLTTPLPSGSISGGLTDGCQAAGLAGRVPRPESTNDDATATSGHICDCKVLKPWRSAGGVYPVGACRATARLLQLCGGGGCDGAQSHSLRPAEQLERGW